MFHVSIKSSPAEFGHMSKLAAIHTAICLQIASENKAVPEFRGVLGVTPGSPAGTTGLYDATTIRGFLANVAFRLRNDTPALEFKWSSMDPDKCLSDKLWVLEQDIFERTTEIPSATPKEGSGPSPKQ
jgi:hypothetical protein